MVEQPAHHSQPPLFRRDYSFALSRPGSWPTSLSTIAKLSTLAAVQIDMALGPAQSEVNLIQVAQGMKADARGGLVNGFPFDPSGSSQSMF
jgi:hypothetical protein